MWWIIFSLLPSLHKIPPDDRKFAEVKGFFSRWLLIVQNSFSFIVCNLDAVDFDRNICKYKHITLPHRVWRKTGRVITVPKWAPSDSLLIEFLSLEMTPDSLFWKPPYHEQSTLATVNTEGHVTKEIIPRKIQEISGGIDKGRNLIII